MGGGPCSTREAGHVGGRARVVAAQEREEGAGRVPVGVVASLVGGDRGQAGAELVGRAAQRPAGWTTRTWSPASYRPKPALAVAILVGWARRRSPAATGRSPS